MGLYSLHFSVTTSDTTSKTEVKSQTYTFLRGFGTGCERVEFVPLRNYMRIRSTLLLLAWKMVSGISFQARFREEILTKESFVPLLLMARVSTSSIISSSILGIPKGRMVTTVTKPKQQQTPQSI